MVHLTCRPYKRQKKNLNFLNIRPSFSLSIQSIAERQTFSPNSIFITPSKTIKIYLNPT